MNLTSLLILILSMALLLLSTFMLFNNIFIYFTLPIEIMISFQMQISTMLDWMSCMFMSTVLMISSMILMYSMYYIPNKEHKQFFLMLMMFILSMMILILSNNILLMLLGWDMLGISSYILVIYYQNYSTASCGSITLLSNRIGDIMILLSISMLLSLMNWELNMNESFSLLILIMLMLASCTKSAQFPFSAWLPMAMSAPTPISALVHSSTLVTAGIYLMIRMSSIIHPMMLISLMMISSITALYAGMSANWEQDMKKIIALSTLSQMAMMMFAVSMKSSPLSYFHLIIHAYFKSLMFMCAGIMIHESSYQDMRMMKMNSNFNPSINSILGISNMALMGLPFTSGFFSKDSIIENMISSKLESLLTLMMIMSIGMTSSYSLRMMYLSNKSLIKNKPDSINHTNIYSNNPIILMSTTPIILGTLMLWMMNPQHMFMFPNYYKMLIIMTLITGFLIGMLLSFKSYLYKSLGQSSISLWFTHFLSTNLSTSFYPLMNISFENDKNWQENYGPNKSFNKTSKMSLFPETSKSSTLLTLMMICLLPMMLI
uniref:NADH-ubiquinone oxidoreductase chain 5 n=1 Tax=Oxyopes hupingensis TaxID=2713554 RepID=A0A6G6DA09_9ARAC|nr:NADH dehydrogenase subunit 5 [Oxyopes hupingensis]QIE13335.1 NADH dehydrogenase subunit 5 [Oxyopes hupingensis]